MEASGRRPGAITILFKLPGEGVAVRLEGTLMKRGADASWAVELRHVPDEIHGRLEAYVRSLDQDNRPTLELSETVLDELRRTARQMTEEPTERVVVRWR